jgi:hypothetical protein
MYPVIRMAGALWRFRKAPRLSVGETHVIPRAPIIDPLSPNLLIRLT